MYKHCRTKKCTVNTENMRKKETSLTLQTLFFILWGKNQRLQRNEYYFYFN